MRSRATATNIAFASIVLFGIQLYLASASDCKSGVHTIGGSCCVFPFIFKNQSYSNCTTEDDGNSYWCATTPNYDLDNSKWGNCKMAGSSCKSGMATTTGACCVFPFRYNDQSYSKCTTVDNGNTLWCSTTPIYDSNSIFGACAIECKAEELEFRSSATFRTPGYPNNYPNGADCSWKLKTRDGYSVYLTFQPGFSVQSSVEEDGCSTDFVDIRDGPNASDKQLGLLCGRSNIESRPVQTTGQYMFVRFKGSLTSRNRGYQAFARAVKPVCRGTTKLNSSSGSITTPNYPHNYDNDTICTWLITVPTGHVRLEFKSFSTVSIKICDTDYLVVRDGKSHTSALKGLYCGKTIPPVLISETNSLWIQFVTDSDFTDKGFSATYSSTKVAVTEKPHGYGWVAAAVLVPVVLVLLVIGAVYLWKRYRHRQKLGYNRRELVRNDSIT